MPRNKRDKLMTVPEVAAFFKVTPGTVRLWITREKNPLPAIKGNNGRWKVYRSDMEALAQKMYGEDEHPDPNRQVLPNLQETA